jgi:hypothetical protein
MLSMSVLDVLMESGQDLALVESDTSNPDVYKMYGELVEHRLLNLDEVDGWMDLVNYADAVPDRTLVVNTAARNNAGVERFGAMLRDSLAELGREMITLWVINRQRDSLELLKAYREVMPESVVHVVRNGYFGEEHKFELYNASQLRTTIEEAGGKSYLFPDMADRVVDELYSRRLPIAQAARELPIGNRAELKRWREAAHRVVRDAIGLA